MNAPVPQYGQPQYGQPQQYAPPQYGQPQYGQPQQYAPPQYGGMPPAGYGGMPFQGVGATFQLMPGEYLLISGGMQRCIFPAGNTFMRLTNQRLTFCHISRGLTIFVSWLFIFSEETTISQTFTREEIVNMEIRPCFLRRKLVITDRYGQSFGFAPNWFSDNLILRIMSWWQTGN